MKVKDLKEDLSKYDDNAEVVVVDWANGVEFTPSIGSDDEDEGSKFCRIGI